MSTPQHYLLDANGKYLVDANGKRLIEGTPGAVVLLFDSNIGPYQLWWYFDDTADPPVLESAVENQPRGRLYTLPPTPTGNDAPAPDWNQP